MENIVNNLTHHSFYVYINGEVYFETSSKCLLNAKSHICNHYPELSDVLEEAVYFGSCKESIKHKEFIVIYHSITINSEY